MVASAAPRDWTSKIPVPIATLGLLFASVGFGFVPFFSRGLTDEGLASHAVAFYRYTLAALLLSPILLTQLRQWRVLLWGIVSGVTMGLGWIGYVSALKTAPASTVGVLYMTYPVFTVLIAWILFQDKPSLRALVATGIVIIAAIVASSPAAVPQELIPTLLLSLAAPFGFGLSISVLVHRLTHIPPLGRIASVSLGAVLGLAPLMLASETAEVVPDTAQTWVMVAGIALLTAFVPQLIYTICSPLIGTSRSAVLGSVELPTMFAISVFAFGETLSAAQIIACGLILSAIWLVQSRATRNVATNIARR